MTINREQVAGLRYALDQHLIADTATRQQVENLIAQAQAAPEAEPVATIKWNQPDCDWKLTMLCEPAHPEGVALNLYEAPQHDAELVELLEAAMKYINSQVFYKFGEPVTKADREGQRIVDELRAKLATLSAKNEGVKA